MRRQSLGYLIAAGLGLLAVGLMALVLSPRAPAASAAPRQIHALYLPLVWRACAPSQLVRDSSFEGGVPNASWVTSSTMSSDILDDSAIPAPNPTHSGAWKAWLGGNDSVEEALWQVIAVPTGVTLQVSFWRRVTTDEPSPFINDKLEVQIRDATGAPLETLETLWDADAGEVWVQHVITPTGNYAGQTIQLAFAAQTDSQYPTSFFIDDVAMQTACAP